MSNKSELPGDLYGRQHTDRYIRFLDLLFKGNAVINRHLLRPVKSQPPKDRSFKVTVTATKKEADGVVSVRLESADGTPLPPWSAGAHVDLTLPSGLKRQYSLSGDPAQRTHYRIAVRLINKKGGSGEIHRLKKGTVLTVSGPHNAFPLVTDRPIHFIAGGIGITPLLAMIHHCERVGHNWRLTYTGRSRKSLPFIRELQALDSKRVHILSDEDNGTPDIAEILAQTPQDAAVYCCGPPPMLKAAYAAFEESPAFRIHTERFSPPPIVDGKPFQIQVGQGGPVLDVPDDQTALDVLTDHDPSTQYSCRQGFCGTCKVKVLSGEVIHHDSRLGEEERRRGDALICVSRSDNDRLVLDL
ncbi:PDR/VanB family oxidoreductase [Haloglycomyces albus]|uniref:PDR/VanB family oxidoreductase n=1 Tax=Haloglycomyces albus TaxID=526067 RepID=UPI00046D4069|nr:PDR/VanB family oxidoreductase [Haloglycomyces albus]